MSKTDEIDSYIEAMRRDKSTPPPIPDATPLKHKSSWSGREEEKWKTGSGYKKESRFLIPMTIVVLLTSLFWIMFMMGIAAGFFGYRIRQ